MRSKSRCSVLLATALTALFMVALAVPSTSSAVILGVSDNKADTFADPKFQALGVKRVRLITPYDSIFKNPVGLDQWIRAAQASGAEPLITFEKPASMVCPGSDCRAPSVASYTEAFRAFRAKYPTILLINPWNEGNSGTQPTGKNPRANALYFNAVKRTCPSCRVIAADVLDIKNMPKWLTTFKRYANRPALWGLHNYGDTNRFRTTGTRTLLKETRGPVWLLETGAIVYFRTKEGKVALPRSESRQARSVRFLLTRLVNIDRRRIQRAYLYNFRTIPEDRFDAGLLRADGSAREAYNIVLSYRKLFR